MARDYWTGEPEPPQYRCVDDYSVIHEGNEIEGCEACLPREPEPDPWDGPALVEGQEVPC